MTVLYEWNFHNRICRVVESEPGIVHFEEASRTTGNPSVMLFNWTTSPLGAANEIVQLSMALAEANIINRNLSASILRFQEDRNMREQEIAALRAELAASDTLARLTANGMRAAAEIARNFRPKSACTCGGYISFHYGIPCHQPGCLVGECLEIADEIYARADEIDETLRA